MGEAFLVCSMRRAGWALWTFETFGRLGVGRGAEAGWDREGKMRKEEACALWCALPFFSLSSSLGIWAGMENKSVGSWQLRQEDICRAMQREGAGSLSIGAYSRASNKRVYLSHPLSLASSLLLTH